CSGHKTGQDTPFSRLQNSQAHFRYVFWGVPLKALIQIGSYHHAIICGYTEKGDKTYPDSHTEIVGTHLEQSPHIGSEDGEIQEPFLSIKPEHQKTSRKSQGNSGKHKDGGRYRTELEIQDKKDGDKGE